MVAVALTGFPYLREFSTSFHRLQSIRRIEAWRRTVVSFILSHPISVCVILLSVRSIRYDNEYFSDFASMVGDYAINHGRISFGIYWTLLPTAHRINWGFFSAVVFRRRIKIIFSEIYSMASGLAALNQNHVLKIMHDLCPRQRDHFVVGRIANES